MAGHSKTYYLFADIGYTVQVQIIAVGNHKGGVAKTTTVATVAAQLAIRGRRVLMVDTDPQGGLTRLVGAPHSPSLADVIGLAAPGLPMSTAVYNVAERLDLVPAARALAACELALTARVAREHVLAKALAPLSAAYDVCLIDCPPSLGLLTVAALAAARGVLVPTKAAALDLGAVADYLETIATIRAEINPGLQLVGVVVVMATKTNAVADAIDAMRSAGWPLMRSTIGASTRVAEAAAIHQVITTYDPTSDRATEYTDLTKEIERWLKTATH